MILPVILLGSKVLHQGKKQGRHGDVVHADIACHRIDVLLPGDAEIALGQEFEQGHDNDAEQKQQGPLQAMGTRKNGQAVIVHVVAQQDIAVVVGESAKHVVAVL